MWQCRLCWTQNEPTETLCQVCKKGVYPDDAVVAGEASAGAPVGKRGIGAVIVPGGPAAPAAPGAGLPPPSATPLVTPASPRRKGVRAALVVVVLLIVLAAVVVGIVLAAGVAVPWSGTGAFALSMLFLPTRARGRPGSRGGGSPGR